MIILGQAWEMLRQTLQSMLNIITVTRSRSHKMVNGSRSTKAGSHILRQVWLSFPTP